MTRTDSLAKLQIALIVHHFVQKLFFLRQTGKVKELKMEHGNRRHGLCPQQLASLCINDIIPNMDTKYRTVLQENQAAIQSVLMQYNIDSFRVQWIKSEEFSDFMDAQYSISWSAFYLWEALREKMKSEKYTMNWKHITNAIKHELNDAIARTVSS